MTVSCQPEVFLTSQTEFMPSHQVIINQTQKWLQTVIIAHSLCPFAKREFDSGRIHYAVSDAADLPEQLTCIIEHCAALDRDTDRETTLLIFPDGLSEFENYLDLIELANALLKDQGYEGTYQLASFHPQYRFAGSDETDPSHYTNRSPYPMVHILREASVEAALKRYPDPEKIPTRNIKLTQNLGLRAMKALLDDCYD